MQIGRRYGLRSLWRRTQDSGRTDPTPTDRYLDAVAHEVPHDRRDEVRAQLRERIEVDLTRRVAAGTPAAEAERQALETLGDPRRVADEAAGPRWLVGPRVYPDYLRVLRLVAVIALPIIAAAVAIASGLAGQNPVEVVFSALAAVASAAVQIAFWVTIAFVVVDRSGAQPPSMRRAWTIEDLPAPARVTVSLGDTITGIVLSVLLIGVVLWPWQYEVTAGAGSVPVLASGLPAVTAVLVGILVAGIVLDVVLYLVGRWTILAAVVNILLDATFAGIVIWLVATDQLFDPAFLAALGETPTLDPAQADVVIAAMGTGVAERGPHLRGGRRDRLGEGRAGAPVTPARRDVADDRAHWMLATTRWSQVVCCPATDREPVTGARISPTGVRGNCGTVGYLIASQRNTATALLTVTRLHPVDEPLGSRYPARRTDPLQVGEVDRPDKTEDQWEIRTLGDVDGVLLLQRQIRQIQLRYGYIVFKHGVDLLQRTGLDDSPLSPTGEGELQTLLAEYRVGLQVPGQTAVGIRVLDLRRDCLLDNGCHHHGSAGVHDLGTMLVPDNGEDLVLEGFVAIDRQIALEGSRAVHIEPVPAILYACIWVTHGVLRRIDGLVETRGTRIPYRTGLTKARDLLRRGHRC